MRASNRQLMWNGMFLFLLGLVTGFLEQRFTNMRMGLAAHLEGVMNGAFLIALGAIWNQVRLPRPARAAAYLMALYGTYDNSCGHLWYGFLNSDYGGRPCRESEHPS